MKQIERRSVQKKLKFYCFFFFAVFLLAVVACSSSKPKTAIEEGVVARDKVAERIHDIVTDPGRAERASFLAKKIFKEYEAFARIAKETRLRAFDLSSDYDASHKAFDELFETFFNERRVRSERTIAYTFEIRSVVTTAEWAEINKVFSKELLSKRNE